MSPLSADMMPLQDAGDAELVPVRACEQVIYTETLPPRCCRLIAD